MRLCLWILLLWTPPLPAAEPDQASKVAFSFLERPMLESDSARPMEPVSMRATSQPSLLENPSLDDPLPLGPLTQEEAKAPAPLLVQGPRLQPPPAQVIEADPTEPDPLVPAAPAPADPNAPLDTAVPEVPEAPQFATQPYRPASALPPDILGIPNPILDIAPGPGEELLPVGKVELPKRYSLQLRALLSGLYDDAALVSTKETKPDFIFSFTPAVSFLAGTPLSRASVQLTYAPLMNWYTQGTSKDGVNQNALLTAHYNFGKLLVGLNASAATSLSGGSLDSGPVSESQTYLVAVSSVYQYSAKTSLDATVDENVVKNSTQSNTNETRLQGFVNYQLGNLKLGIGALGGELDDQGESTQHYIQSLGRIIYAPLGRKLSLNATAGYEYRDLGGGSGHSEDPVFQIGASYLLLPKTVLTVDTQRHVFASVSSGGQNYVLTAFNGMIRQGFNGYGRNFFLSLAGGVQVSKYSGSGASGGEDDFFYTRVALDWAARDRVLLGAFYEYSEDSTTRQNTVGFKRNRIGLHLTVIFF